MIVRVEKFKPLMDVIAFKETVGGEWAAAGSVGAGVGEEDGESVGEEELRVSGHADAVVAETVEEEDVVAVGVMGTNAPGAESDIVRRCDRGVGEIGVK
jgi:hypothetical protein